MTAINAPNPTRTVKAVFRDGAFRPIEAVSLPPGTEVELHLPYTDEEVDAMMKARFPKSWGCGIREDVEEVMRIVNEEFGKFNPNDWK